MWVQQTSSQQTKSIQHTSSPDFQFYRELVWRRRSNKLLCVSRTGHGWADVLISRDNRHKFSSLSSDSRVNPFHFQHFLDSSWLSFIASLNVPADTLSYQWTTSGWSSCPLTLYSRRLTLVLLYLKNSQSNKSHKLLHDWRRGAFDRGIVRKEKALSTPSASLLSVSQVVFQSHPFLSAVSACLCEELRKYSSVWIKEWEIRKRSLSGTLRPYLVTTKLSLLSLNLSAIKTLHSLQD